MEVACCLGLADGVVDLVETGTTMRAAGLESSGIVMQSETVLIMNPKCQNKPLVEKIRKRMRGFLTASSYQIINQNGTTAGVKMCFAPSTFGAGGPNQNTSRI